MFQTPDHQVSSVQRQPVDFYGPLADKDPGQPLTNDDIEDLTAGFVERARTVAGNAREASGTETSDITPEIAAYRSVSEGTATAQLFWSEVSKLIETTPAPLEEPPVSAFLAALREAGDVADYKIVAVGGVGVGKSDLVAQLLDDPERPERAGVLRSLGRGAASTGHFSEAKYWYDRAAQLEQAIFLLEHARYLRSQGLVQDTEKLLVETLEGIHHQPPAAEASMDALLERARALYFKGYRSAALRLLRSTAADRLRR